MQQCLLQRRFPVHAQLVTGRQGCTYVPCPPSTSAAPLLQLDGCWHRQERPGSLSGRQRRVPRGLQLVRAGPAAVVREKWWEKNNPDNMRTVKSVQDLIDCLAEAQSRLVVVDFYAKWCNACKTLFPKVCQLCGNDPNVLVIKIDWDENKEICKALDIKVLPYFQLYRGSRGKVAEFSASVTKVNKLRDAIAAHSGEVEGIGNVPLLAEFPDTFPSARMAHMYQAANNVVAHPGHGLAKPSRAQKERELQPV